jgi:hypothetical protein
MEQWYKIDNCDSMNEFVEKAINFYVDYLATDHSSEFLSPAILSAINGRLDLLENQMAKMAYKNAVELDMVSGILADAFEYDAEDLRRRRGESVQNVRKTNGQLSFEQKARLREDDEWQG